MISNIINSPVSDIKDEVTFFTIWGKSFLSAFQSEMAAKEYKTAIISRRIYLACADALHIINNEADRANYHSYADLEEAMGEFVKWFKEEAEICEINPVAVRNRLDIINNFLKNRKGTVLPKQLNLFSA